MKTPLCRRLYMNSSGRCLVIWGVDVHNRPVVEEEQIHGGVGDCARVTLLQPQTHWPQYLTWSALCSYAGLMHTSTEALDGNEAYKWLFVHPFCSTGQYKSRDFYYWSAGECQWWVNHKNEPFLLLKLECYHTLMAGLRNNLKIGAHGHICTWPPLAMQTEEMNVSNGGFGVSTDKAWRLVFPPCPGNDSAFQVPCEGDALGASAVWICGVWSSGPSLQDTPLFMGSSPRKHQIF